MIELRDYTQNDKDILVKLANNINVSQYLIYTFPYPYTHADAEYWINEGSTFNGAIKKVIGYQGQFVGSIGITPQTEWKAHCAEIGCWISEQYWGKGIASNALRIMTEQVFYIHNFEKNICACARI